MGINVLSLFDGISCGRLALDRAGIKVNKYYASEIDKNAIKISSNNYKDIIQLGDIKYIDEEVIKGLGKIDLILAGSPCQGFSRAGLGLNFEDSRSKLFFNFVDILNIVKKYNPNAKFLLENVQMKKEWVEVINNYMGVEAISINSKLVSAQNRPRLYWTNINFEPIQDKNINLIDILDKTIEFNYIYHEKIKIDKSISENSRNLISNIDNEVRIKQATKKGYIVANSGDGVNLSFPSSKSRRGRVVNKKSSTLDTSCDLCAYYNDIIRRFTIEELEKLQTLPVGYTNGVAERQRIKAIGNGWTVDVVAHILKGLSC
jgi:DNA (cytosine-5)-methyltransferase 3A